MKTTAQLWRDLNARRARNHRLARVAVLCLGALVPFLYFYLRSHA